MGGIDKKNGHCLVASVNEQTEEHHHNHNYHHQDDDDVDEDLSKLLSGQLFAFLLEWREVEVDLLPCA